MNIRTVAAAWLAGFVLLIAFTCGAEKISCVSCGGTADSNCHRNPEKEAGYLLCDACVAFGMVYENGGTLHHITRTCASQIFPTPIPWRYKNTCKDDNSHYIECTHTCQTANCSLGLSYAPPGWNEDGSRSHGNNITQSLAPLLLAAALFLNCQ